MQITHLPSRTTDSTRELARGKMAAGDDVRDSALRLLAFIIHIYGCLAVGVGVLALL